MKTYLLILVIIFSFVLLISNGLGQTAPDTLWTRILGKPCGESYIKALSNDEFIILPPTYDGYLAALCYNSLSDNVRMKDYRNISSNFQSIESNNRGIDLFYYHYQDGDVWILNMDDEGDTTTIFRRDYTHGYSINSIKPTLDKGYILTAGKVDKFYTYHSDLIKINALGDTIWSRRDSAYFYKNPNYDYCFGLAYDVGDGFLIFVGVSLRYLDDSQQYVLKTDYSGDSLWTKMIGNVNRQFLMKTLDNGFIELSEGGLTKFDKNIEIEWTKNYDWLYRYNYPNGLSVKCLKQCKNGGFVIVGSIETDSTPDTEMLIFRLDENGDSLWLHTVKHKNFFHNVGWDIDETPDGGYVVIGETASYLWLVRLGSDPTNVEQKITSIPSFFSLSQNYPNPFNPSTTIEYSLSSHENVQLEVYDITGQLIETLLNKSMPAGNNKIDFNAENLSSGIYFYRIEAGKHGDVKKMIIIK